jgi:hypothetical protein
MFVDSLENHRRGHMPPAPVMLGAPGAADGDGQIAIGVSHFPHLLGPVNVNSTESQNTQNLTAKKPF